MKWITFILCLWYTLTATGQGEWVFTKLAPLPTPLTNNSISEATLPSGKWVYSFGGISDTLHPVNISSLSFKYSVTSNQWSALPPIPDTLGKIGQKTSFVNNRLYITGGEYIDTISFERITSNKVHVFNPFIDTFEINAAELPVPVHEHAQAVWRDSLLFVISGESNGELVTNVQFYNPFFNTWSQANPIIDNNFYKAKGASAYIVGDTLFYFGGVSGSPNYVANSFMRIGIINPEDPAEINWNYIGQINGNESYKPQCSGHNSTLFCFGGTNELYDIDGFNSDDEYILPKSFIVQFNSKTSNFFGLENARHGAKDLGGIAKLGGGNWIVAGGLDSLGIPMNRVLLMTNKSLSDIAKATQPPFFGISEFESYYLIKTENIGSIEVYELSGKRLIKINKGLADLVIDKAELRSNILLFVYDDGSNVPVTQKRVLIR